MRDNLAFCNGHHTGACFSSVVFMKSLETPIDKCRLLPLWSSNVFYRDVGDDRGPHVSAVGYVRDYIRELGPKD